MCFEHRSKIDSVVLIFMRRIWKNVFFYIRLRLQIMETKVIFQQEFSDTLNNIVPIQVNRNDTVIQVMSLIDINTKKIELPYREKLNNNTDWLTIVLFLCLVLFASVKNSFSKYLKHLIQSVFNYSTACRMFQEKNNSIFQASLRLEIFYFIVVSIFLYQLTVHYKIAFRFEKFYLFLICLGLMIVYYTIKTALYRFVGSLTEQQPEISEYLFNMSNFNRVVGIFIFPITAFIAFNPFGNIEIVVIMGILLLLSFYVLLICRCIGILLKKQVSLFYMFLYLCTLEFLPLLLIYKLVIV